MEAVEYFTCNIDRMPRAYLRQFRGVVGSAANPYDVVVISDADPSREDLAGIDSTAGISADHQQIRAPVPVRVVDMEIPSAPVAEPLIPAPGFRVK